MLRKPIIRIWPNHYSIVGFLTILLIISSCVTSEQVVFQPSNTAAVTVQFPKMAVGDSWTTREYNQDAKGFREIFHREVVEVKPDGGFVVELKGEKTGKHRLVYYNNEYQVTKVKSLKTGKTRNNDTGRKDLSFPLYVGKRWEDKFFGLSVSGHKYDYKDKYKITGFGQLSTKVGTFEAFEIVRDGENRSIDGYSTWRDRYWYSPEVKMIIKMKRSITGDLITLLDYKLAKADHNPPELTITQPNAKGGIVLIDSLKEIVLSGVVNDDSAVKRLTIDGEELAFDQQGKFSFNVTPSGSESTLVIEAVDVHGNTTKKPLTIKYLPPKPVAVSKPSSAGSVVATTAVTENRKANYGQAQVGASIAGKRAAIPTTVRWALIVGISRYKDTRIPPLRYAAADAQSFYDWLVSPGGGKYPPARVRLLINDDATKRNIEEALRGWLKNALEEDLITIFFAGHGSPESPDSPENLFLLSYDSEYDSIAVTGLPMWEIETSLRRFIKAKKVVVLADACHSGGIGQGYETTFRSERGIKVNPINASFQGLSQIGDGVCVISASDVDQLSRESKEWGGGHGVFTYFLLNGLHGDADYNRDGKTSLGELIPYLSETVRRETRNAQSPTVAGKFDPALTIGR